MQRRGRVRPENNFIEGKSRSARTGWSGHVGECRCRGDAAPCFAEIAGNLVLQCVQLTDIGRIGRRDASSNVGDLPLLPRRTNRNSVGSGRERALAERPPIVAAYSDKGVGTDGRRVVAERARSRANGNGVCAPRRAVCAKSRTIVVARRAVCTKGRAVVAARRAACTKSRAAVTAGSAVCAKSRAVVAARRAACTKGRAVVTAGGAAISNG